MITKRIMIIAAALSGLTVAGCGQDHPKAPNIQTETLSHAINFRDGKTQLSHVEYKSLNEFMQTVPVAAVTYVGIAADDSDPREMERAERIKAYLTRQGIEPKAVHLQPTDTPDGQTIELTLEYAKALPLRNCPDWSDDSGFEHNNAMNFSNFGCAYYSDIAVQMENPADYEGAHAPAVSDAQRDSVAIQKYRTGATPTVSNVSASSPGGSTSGATSNGSSVSSTGAAGSQ